MGTSLTYEKKTMSIYHEDLEYLRKLQGVTLSEKLRNLIRKDKQNNEFMNQIFDLNKIYSLVVTIVGGLNLLIAIPLIYFFNSTGAAVSMLICELLITILLFFSCKKYNILPKIN